MYENIEIEYKQMLSEKEYLNLKDYILKSKYTYIQQKNIYFETNKYELLKNKSAIRIRVIGDTYELCMKIKQEQDVLEKNYMLNKEQFEEILDNSELIANYIDNVPSNLKTLGTLITERYELKLDNGLICLDLSKYGDKIDYEVEFEAKNYELENYFRLFLSENNIIYKPNNKSKIIRFMMEMCDDFKHEDFLL